MSEVAARRIEKRGRIVDAAVEIFARKGFRAARVSDIARAAGVADGTIYLYFKSKEDMLLSIFEEKMEMLLDGLNESLSTTDDPSEKIKRFAEFHLEQVRTNPAAAEVLQVELRLSHKFLREYRPEKLWRYLEIFQNIVKDGQESGDFRQDVNPFIASWSFFGAMDELAMQWVLARKSPRFDITVAAEQISSVFIRGLRP